ncbi:ATP-binding protein [Aquipseudomonas ullengensis]|uniref:histidine kinase n=1 Tax=Aquipseudomonas ullengensis TaxID=2759166 RepID=A0A7W4LL84_9GAMM|nr:ATP-binding protein [Pseudomonas ullengensis]MBB2495193.1 sensor histidine kinase N-terminal domain-containing protein [Pseudomonas ullengensis]
MISIRRRILALVLGLLMLGTAVISLFNYVDSSHEITEIYDAQLAQTARLLQGVIQMPIQGVERTQLYDAFNSALQRAGQRKPGHPYESKLAFQVWSAAGELLVSTASAPHLSQPPARPGYANIDLGEHQWRGFLLRDEQQAVLIWVGERDDVRQDLIGRIVRHSLWPSLIGIPLLAALVWWAIGWGLRPLRNMAAVIQGRHADSLEPLQLQPLPSELAPMQAALNRLLFQIDQVLERERRFIADAAHEMRTPLAVLRIHVQNAIQASDEAQRSESLDFLIGGIDRATRVVNQLLTMARVEPSLARGNWPRIDLQAVVRETLAELTPWVLKQGLELSLDVAEGDYRINADAGAVGIALQNLVTNAVNFSPAGGQVRVLLSAQAQDFLLSVEDQGPGIEAQELEQVFERFYRRDNSQGAGLGLAIVQMITSRLGGRVVLANRVQGGLQASLMLPRQPA